MLFVSNKAGECQRRTELSLVNTTIQDKICRPVSVETYEDKTLKALLHCEILQSEQSWLIFLVNRLLDSINEWKCFSHSQ